MVLGLKMPTSLSEKIGPLPLWGWALGIGVLMFAKKHWGVGAIGGAGVQGIGGGILGGGIGGYGDGGWGCDDEGYCGEGGGGGRKKHGGGGGGMGPGGGGGGRMGWY